MADEKKEVVQPDPPAPWVLPHSEHDPEEPVRGCEKCMELDTYWEFYYDYYKRQDEFWGPDWDGVW